jgi:DNA-binding NarL/FixJ family response regulator
MGAPVEYAYRAQAVVLLDEKQLSAFRSEPRAQRLIAYDSGKSLRHALLHVQPGWLLIGPDVEDENVRQTVDRVQLCSPRTKIAVLGSPTNITRCERWIRNGATCYLSSTNAPHRILQLLSLSEEQNVVIIDPCFREGYLRLLRQIQPQVPLSGREVQVLDLAAHGLHTDEIASRANLTGHTIEFHFRNIISKLGVRNRTQAVARALALGLITAMEIDCSC